jgi:UDP-N-acetylglucosamine--N-acetylmuramyl-(pentapeptide) pyrophosphoryl-undecaprenol N-acetylglucosamine transferase
MAKAGGARMILQKKFTAVELAKQMQKLGLDPEALTRAPSARNPSVGPTPRKTSQTWSSAPAAILPRMRLPPMKWCSARSPRVLMHERCRH